MIKYKNKGGFYMFDNNIEIVEKLPNGRKNVKIEKEIVIQAGKYVVEGKPNKLIKFTIVDENDIVNILDSKGELSGIQFFDTYFLNEFGDVIIGIKKDGEEYYERILSRFDLSDTKCKTIVTPSEFNIKGYDKRYYEYEAPTKTIAEIIPQSYSFNYGLINRNGLLVIYPMYDSIQFGNENTCIVGLLGPIKSLIFGYNDVLSGDAITPVCFDAANDFYDSRAVVKYKYRYGYIDRQKIMTNPDNLDEYAKELAPTFYYASNFEDGIATVTYIPGNTTKIDTNGEWINPMKWELIKQKSKNQSNI